MELALNRMTEKCFNCYVKTPHINPIENICAILDFEKIFGKSHTKLCVVVLNTPNLYLPKQKIADLIIFMPVSIRSYHKSCKSGCIQVKTSRGSPSCFRLVFEFRVFFLRLVAIHSKRSQFLLLFNPKLGVYSVMSFSKGISMKCEN